MTPRLYVEYYPWRHSSLRHPIIPGQSKKLRDRRASLGEDVPCNIFVVRLGNLVRLGRLGRLAGVVLSGGGVEIIPYSFLTVTKYRCYSASIKIYFLSLLYYFEIISTS